MEKEIIAKKDDIAQVITSNPLFGHILLIDEKKGRKIATTLNIKIIGFLGILVLNYHQGKIDKSEAKALINKVKSFQFRLSEKLEAHFFTLLS